MTSNDEETELLHFLFGSCELLPPSCFKLRSYFSTHLANIADQHNLQLLKNFRNRNKSCPYCYSSWNGNTTSLKLLPSKRIKTPHAKTTVMENWKRQTSQLNESRNTLVLKCRVCSKKSSFSLIKRKPVKENVKEDEVIAVKKKKKKKKKDRSCGLAVNLIKPEINLPEIVLVKKKKRVKATEESATSNSPGCTQSGTSKSTPVSKNISNPAHCQNKWSHKNSPPFRSNSDSVSGSSKNFLLNPFAAQIQHNLSKKKDKKLERLKQAVKGERESTKKTLKDFLKLI